MYKKPRWLSAFSSWSIEEFIGVHGCLVHLSPMFFKRLGLTAIMYCIHEATLDLCWCFVGVHQLHPPLLVSIVVVFRYISTLTTFTFSPAFDFAFAFGAAAGRSLWKVEARCVGSISTVAVPSSCKSRRTMTIALFIRFPMTLFFLIICRGGWFNFVHHCSDFCAAQLLSSAPKSLTSDSRAACLLFVLVLASASHYQGEVLNRLRLTVTYHVALCVR